MGADEEMMKDVSQNVTRRNRKRAIKNPYTNAVSLQESAIFHEFVGKRDSIFGQSKTRLPLVKAFKNVRTLERGSGCINDCISTACLGQVACCGVCVGAIAPWSDRFDPSKHVIQMAVESVPARNRTRASRILKLKCSGSTLSHDNPARVRQREAAT